MPRIASVPIIKPQPIVGLSVMRPRMSSISCEPAFCAAWPTAKKIADLVSECTVMCSSAAKFATGPPMPNANVMMPMCSIGRVSEQALDVALPPEEERREHDGQQTEAHHHARRQSRLQRALDQHLAAHDRVDGDVQQQPRQHCGDRRRAFGVRVGQPVVQRREPDLGAVADQQKYERQAEHRGLELRLHDVRDASTAARSRPRRRALSPRRNTAGSCRTAPARCPRRTG